MECDEGEVSRLVPPEKAARRRFPEREFSRKGGAGSLCRVPVTPTGQHNMGELRQMRLRLQAANFIDQGVGDSHGGGRLVLKIFND